MIPKLLLSIASLLICANAMSQSNSKIKIEIEDGPNPWNNLNLNNSEETFQFAIVTDRTGGHRPGIFLDGVKKLNLLQPEFVMSVGDLIEGYTEDTARLNWEWQQFNGFIDSLQMPFFYIPGNHDITNKVMEDKWKELFGKTYFHFRYKDVLFLCLNSEDNYRGAGRGTIDEAQYSYISEVLSEHTDVKWTLLFMHQPLWNQQDTKKWKDVEKLLAKRKHTVFVGHNHRYRKYERNNGKYFVLATTGGGSSLRGANFGEFDHVVWVTMTDSGPILANLLLEGIWDENVMTEDLADFVFPISNNMPIAVTPSFVDDLSEASIKPTIKITNNTEKLMQADMKILSSRNIFVEPYYFQDTINPNDVATMEMMVKQVNNVENIEDAEGLKLEIKIAYEMEGRPDIELSEIITIKPALKYDLPARMNKVQVDGNLEEWKELEFQVMDNAYVAGNPFTHTGNDDASAQFGINYDEDFLYIAVEVKDDDLMVQDGKNPLYQDAIVIFVDPRPADHFNRTSQYNLFADWSLLAITPDENGTIYQKQRLPIGTTCKTKKTDSGYTMEAAVPISYLKKSQQSDWKNVRINVMINDYDQDGHHVSRISWKPIWTEEDNYLGSGTFFK